MSGTPSDEPTILDKQSPEDAKKFAEGLSDEDLDTAIEVHDGVSDPAKVKILQDEKQKREDKKNGKNTNGEDGKPVAAPKTAPPTAAEANAIPAPGNDGIFDLNQAIFSISVEGNVKWGSLKDSGVKLDAAATFMEGLATALDDGFQKLAGEGGSWKGPGARNFLAVGKAKSDFLREVSTAIKRAPDAGTLAASDSSLTANGAYLLDMRKQWQDFYNNAWNNLPPEQQTQAQSDLYTQAYTEGTNKLANESMQLVIGAYNDTLNELRPLPKAANPPVLKPFPGAGLPGADDKKKLDDPNLKPPPGGAGGGPGAGGAPNLGGGAGGGAGGGGAPDLGGGPGGGAGAPDLGGGPGGGGAPDLGGGPGGLGGTPIDEDGDGVPDGLDTDGDGKIDAPLPPGFKDPRTNLTGGAAPPDLRPPPGLDTPPPGAGGGNNRLTPPPSSPTPVPFPIRDLPPPNLGAGNKPPGAGPGGRSPNLRSPGLGGGPGGLGRGPGGSFNGDGPGGRAGGGSGKPGGFGGGSGGPGAGRPVGLPGPGGGGPGGRLGGGPGGGMPMAPPMGGGAGGGGGKKEEERDRTAWLLEDDDVWGGDDYVPPSVLGRPDSDY